ncbi:hypothetical protein EMCRGX_G011197 [Ephydatia muelleri]
MGKARRPQRGAQYGRAYLEPYRKDIKKMFDQGARISSDKISPYAMLEELQSLYPGHYTLPGEDEIHAEITKSFGRKKACDENNGAWLATLCTASHRQLVPVTIGRIANTGTVWTLVPVTIGKEHMRSQHWYSVDLGPSDYRKERQHWYSVELGPSDYREGAHAQPTLVQYTANYRSWSQ